MQSRGLARIVMTDGERHGIQCLLFVLLLHTQTSAITNPDANKLFIEARLDVREVDVSYVYDLIVYDTPLRQKLEDLFGDLPSVPSVLVNGVTPVPHQLSVQWILRFVETVNQYIRNNVSLVVLDMDRNKDFTVNNISFPIARDTGIFNHQPNISMDLSLQEDAIDWCSDPKLFSCRGERKCHDTGLRYECLCPEHLKDNGTDCIANWDPVVEFKFDLDTTGFDFSDTTSEFYNQTKKNVSEVLYNLLKKDVPELESVLVIELRSGSLIATCRLILSTTGTYPTMAFTLMNLAGQRVELWGQDTTIVLLFPKGRTLNRCDILLMVNPNCADKICLIEGPRKTTCICTPGFKERSDSDTTCIDVDECTIDGAHNCEQLCVNTEGSFTCSCRDGFILNNDLRTCRRACGETFQQSSGTLQTPGYNRAYTVQPPHCSNKEFQCRYSPTTSCASECIWKITTQPGMAVKLTIEDIDTRDYECCTNNVEIRNGPNEQSDLLGVLCGKAEPEPFISTSNTMYIRLSSSYPSSYGTRFSASWTTVCPDVVKTTLPATIQSPGYPIPYPPNVDCTYVIDLTAGRAIDLNKITFQLESSSQCNHYLQIGKTRYCGSKPLVDLKTGSSSLVLHFHSDSSTPANRRGFSIELKEGQTTIQPPRTSGELCKEWHKKALAMQSYLRPRFSRLPRCPCTIRNNAGVDNMKAYGFVDPTGTRRSYHLSRMRGISLQPLGKYCRYNNNGKLEEERNLAYNPRLPEFERMYKKEEQSPYIACCQKSKNCHLYDEVRPNLKDKCLTPWNHDGAVPIVWGVFWGEPHIVTLDKAEYTFNGWGEYTLLRVSSNNVNFTLQGRTSPFEMDTGRLVNATVFTAFGARENAVTVFVELDQDTRTSLIVYGDGRDLTLPFRENPVFSWDAEDYLLQRQNDSLFVSFPSGIGIQISVRMKTLSVSIAMPSTFSNQTEGLLGNFNGDKYDDFTLPNGTALPINLTEKEIYYQFGSAWAVTETDTVMVYEQREGPADHAHPEFVPVFLDEQPATLRRAAEEQCHSDTIACVYDYIATGNRDLALDSKTVKDEADESAVLERNSEPIIDAPSTLHVVPNVMVNFTLKGYDDDNETVTFYAVDITSGELSVDKETGHVTFLPPATNPPKLSFYAMDPNGVASVTKEVLLLICDCGTTGRCNFPNITTRASDHTFFKYVECVCESGWDGAKCDQDRDGCIDAPCLPGQNCTDLSPAEEQRLSVGYDCGPCPQGYNSSSALGISDCVDINECDPTQNNDCDMLCENTEGSYSCGCRAGYYLGNDKKSCLDINECAEKLDSCSQKCRNTVGGFECYCEGGHTYNQTSNTCTTDQATAILCNSAGCSQGCKPSTQNNMPQCFCMSGYDIDPVNPSNCVDRDECQSNLCSQRCSNTIGSFTCSCHSGYQLNQDQRTCLRCPEQRYGIECNNTCTCSGRGLACHPAMGCVCPEGWRGTHCEQDVNECTESPEICGVEKECVNTEGSYICGCPPGYIVDYANQCQDFDECAESYDTCGPLENCVNVPGNFNCTCKTGYRREGDSCVDIDECLSPWSNKCQQECVNVPGSFNCRCSYKYKLASDRLSCVTETDPCLLQSGSSLNCEYGCGINDDDSVFCLRPSVGFYFNRTSQTFADIDECKNVSSCSHTCTNIEGSFNCSCPDGMILDNDHRTCLTCPSGTYGKDCAKQCNCGRGASGCDVITGCICQVGWTGNNCDTDLNECDDTSVQLQCQGNARCVNTPGSYRCQCQNGYRKDNSGVCNDVDECESSPCDQQCENSPGSYHCMCGRGFTLDDTTGICEDIDECATDGVNNCSQSCLNNPGSYVCACDQPGYQLADDGVSCIVQASVCGGTWTSITGTIKSPNFPSDYNNSLDCVYVITVPDNYYISLSFTTFELEVGYDFVEVRDGGSDASPIFDAFTGSLLPFTLRSSQHQMWINLRTDGSVVDRGFIANYTADQLPSCGGTWMARSGVIQSPNFPNPFSNGLNCVYTIIAPVNGTIVLNFTAFDLETNVDFLEVRNAMNETIRRFSGGSLPGVVLGNQIILNFNTESSVGRFGFEAHFTSLAGCEETWTSLTGRVQSPNFPSAYTNSLDCIYMIKVPSGHNISLTFTAFEVEQGFDFVEINDGGIVGSLSLGRFDEMSTPHTFNASSNQMWIYFHTDHSVTKTGFSADYTSVP